MSNAGSASTVNRRIVLAARPHGAPTADDFRLEQVAMPEPADGELRLRNLWLSLDPYMRGRMSDAKSYADPVAIDATMIGGTVSRVDASNHGDYAVGDLVSAFGGWQEYAICDGTGLVKLDPDMDRPSRALGVLGMPGFTAYMGLLDIGRPQRGETVVVAAARGAVGSVVGQIAKLQGCHVVGIAGGPEKCRSVVDELGFDACLDHRSETLSGALAEACPDGIDVYFENVGGKVFDAVLPLLNTHARIPVCGLIANYNATALPEGPDRTSVLQRAILTKRLTLKGFIIFDYADRFGEFQARMGDWVRDGSIVYREDVRDGLENAPDAFIGLLEGRNIGKQVVRIATS